MQKKWTVFACANTVNFVYSIVTKMKLKSALVHSIVANQMQPLFFLSNFQFKLAYGLNKKSNQQNRGFHWINIKLVWKKNKDKFYGQKICSVSQTMSNHLHFTKNRFKIEIRLIFVCFMQKRVYFNILHVNDVKSHLLCIEQKEVFENRRPEMIGIIVRRDLITSKCFVHFWYC